MAKIIMITGGQRSGKSSFAERMALELTEGCKQGPVYLATARIWDSEFAHRVELHKARRGERWTNLECEKYLSECNLQGRVVVIDCVTLWATNFFFDESAAAAAPVAPAQEPMAPAAPYSAAPAADFGATASEDDLPF